MLCAHCDRPICTDCMIEASVGWQCPECTSEGAKRSRHVPAFTHTSRGRTGVVGSTNPTPIVLTIIAINVVVFFLEGFGTNARVVDRYAMYPIGVHFQHQYYRAFTAMWLHASFTHIFFNMIALLIVGPALEVLLGKARFLVLYLLAGLGGSVGSYILSQPNVAGIGASGAIMGVLGAYVVVGLRRRLPVAPVVGPAGPQLRHRVHGQHRLAGPPRGSGHRVRAGLRLRLRRRTAGPGPPRWCSPSGGAWPCSPCWRCSSPPSPRVTSISVEPGRPIRPMARLVDSETKIAILFHQWA